MWLKDRVEKYFDRFLLIFGMLLVLSIAFFGISLFASIFMFLGKENVIDLFVFTQRVFMELSLVLILVGVMGMYFFNEESIPVFAVYYPTLRVLLLVLSVSFVAVYFVEKGYKLAALGPALQVMMLFLVVMFYIFDIRIGRRAK